MGNKQPGNLKERVELASDAVLQASRSVGPLDLIMYPGCPAEEAEKIARHTAERGSGRVGRSAAGRNLEEQALELAVAAWIRHRWTEYDTLLANESYRSNARELVRHRVWEVVDRWKGRSIDFRWLREQN